jgi:hypothetical protein
MTPKLKLNRDFFNFWEHHRNDWQRIYQSLQSLHTDDGILFSNSFEEFVMFSPSTNEFIGISHRVPKHPAGIAKYDQNHDLEAVFSSREWQQKKGRCRGIITFSEYAAADIRQRTDIPVLAVPHPFQTRRPESKASREVLLFSGHWMRDFKAFFELETSYQKVLLDCVSGMWDGATEEFAAELAPFRNDTVTVKGYVPDDEYDELMQSSVIFLWLHDASACNTILDCIASNTPLIVNRLPAVEEYLGDYPLICDSLDEVQQKLNDDCLAAAREHLRGLDKTRFTYEAFISNIADSEFYAKL